MDGYYKDTVLTNEIIKDGWLYTGDEGEIDSEGFLKITGRVKDIFKTSKGKYVAPSPIEMALSSNKNIEQVCIVGTGIPNPIALVTLSEIGLNKSKSDLSQSFENTLNIVNDKIESHETINKIVILNKEWTVENGFLTPTMKIKRKSIEKLYKNNYIEWYESETIIVFTDLN